MIILLFILFLCWGSFLNMLAWRLIKGNITAPRSQCPQCSSSLAWYDLIPVLSWIILQGRCRSCKKPISVLYPLIELITAISLTALWVVSPLHYFFAYSIFFSGLIITLRTDIEFLLISRFATLFLIPFGLIAAATHHLPISLFESCIGAVIGYGFLWLIATAFYFITGKVGMGEGDFELMALIGAFLGPVGCWFTLLVGSISGSLLGMLLILLHKGSANTKLPFGAFLAFSALIVTLIYPFLHSILV